MSKEFLKLGIDHGTSNSSIAVMENGRVRVIKVNGFDEIMPSVVYIDKRGRTFVGTSAYNSMWSNKPDEGDGYTGYKIRIGQEDSYEFRKGQKTLSAPQLGGLVMETLLRAYRDETGEEAPGAVITVPAMFEHSACVGTAAAARAAGLKLAPQIQEPIAASMAYGFTAGEKRAQWMIFDLGGGTLDISLVFVRQGRMVVAPEGHAGDNRLGGREFDRDILDYVLAELRKQYALTSFAEKNSDNRHAWGRLLIACEKAKIQLSTKPEAVVEVDGVLCQDEKGRDVVVEIPITRTAYELMISSKIQKAIHLCKELLDKNRLAPGDLSKCILIGGPTKTPYIQQCLANALNMEVGVSINPMTAVAMGAAIFAATVEVPEELRSATTVPETIGASFVSLELEYERTPKTSPSFVGGKVVGELDGFEDLSVEIRRSDGWSTGRVPVDADGTFVCDVALIDEGRVMPSNFETRLINSSGETLATLSEPQMLYPYTTEIEARLANSLLIATQANHTVTLAVKGSGLPAKQTREFLTTKQLKKGSSEDALHIPVMEGVTNLFGEENGAADLNVHIGSLIIKGDDEKITCDLPEGSQLEVTVYMDESRMVRCIAYVKLLDEEFEGVIVSEKFDIEIKDVEAHLAAAQAALEEAEQLQREYPTPGVDDRFHVLHELKIVEEIAKQIERAKLGERDALYRSYRRVLELLGGLSLIGAAQTETRIRRHIARLKKAVKDDEERDLNSIESGFQEAIQTKDQKQLAKAETALGELDNRVRLRPYFDVLLDGLAINDTKVSSEQLEVFNQGSSLLHRIEAKGGIDHLTASDLAELEAIHRRFVDHFSNLWELRAEWIKKNGVGITAYKPKGAPRTDVKVESGRNY